jgi:hypothetical protein
MAKIQHKVHILDMRRLAQKMSYIVLLLSFQTKFLLITWCFKNGSMVLIGIAFTFHMMWT